MPSKTLNEQNGNSCAAHCTVISIWEIKNTALTEDYAEKDLWPAIKFVDIGGPTTMLAAQNNSDPRLIVSEIKKRWSGVNAKLLCDSAQKTNAMVFVPSVLQSNMEALFNFLAHDGLMTPVRLDECTYYNCSYTMHGGGKPMSSNFTGMHNILVTYMGGKTYYYNPNETIPSWKITDNWKKLENQNSNSCSYVFSGVAVAIF
jgi:hypothetical protein